MATTDRRPRAVLVITGIALAAAGTGWAVATVFAPPAALPSSDFAYARVVEGEVSSAISLSTAAEWPVAMEVSNQAIGVVTSLDHGPGASASAGEVLYTVGLRPVVVARGAVPAFRSLAPDSVGADVAQLQSFLAEAGYYSGPVDGQYGAGTGDAVRAWQKALGVQPDGVVQAGDLVFVPELPARVVLDDESFEPGAALVGAERAIGVLAPRPVFTITVSAAQGATIPDGARVEITGPQGDAWAASVAGRSLSEEGSVVLELEGEGQSAICGDACDSLPVGATQSLDSSVLLVEPTAGLVVPSVALATRADGELVVVDDEGLEHPVVVIASARGTSVIEGAAAGLRVRIPQEQE